MLSITATAALLVLLTVPLLSAHAEQRSVDLHEARLAAATRFAALADSLDASARPEALESDLLRYQEVTGTTKVWLVDTNGEVLAPRGEALPDDVAGLPSAIDDALDGTPTSAPAALWPWRTEPMVAATPIGRDAQVLGAVVMVEDTAGPRGEMTVRIAIWAGAALVVVALIGWLVAVPLVGWVVRPVEDLEERVHELGRGGPTTAGRVEGPPELRRLVQSFNEMADSVEHSREQQRNLIADVSHQLANPLTALRLRLENLAANDPAAVPVLAETERMAKTLEDVIEVSRAGGFDRQIVTVDVVEQLRERVALWQPLFDEHLTLDIGPEQARTELEADLVPTIVDALLDNALKYAPGARVDVSLQRYDDTVRLVVRDAGTGISPAEASQIGQRFHRLERHADIEGTGLGLSILQLRVRDAGGELAITPADPGTRIEIRLPVPSDH